MRPATVIECPRQASRILQRIHCGHHGYSVAFCPQGGAGHDVSAPMGEDRHRPLRVHGSGGATFPIPFNMRTVYRQAVSLSGTYQPPGADILRRMTVEDLSMTGMHVRPLLPPGLHIDDGGTVAFARDDARHTEWCQHAIVRWCARHAFSAGFCNPQLVEQGLDFALRPGS